MKHSWWKQYGSCLILPHDIGDPPDPLLRFAQDIACVLNWGGYEALIAGGWVRDKLLHQTPKDLDMTTPAPAAYIRNMEVPSGATVVPTGEQYGTFTFIRDELKIEVTVCRKDFGNHEAGDNRRDVQPEFIHTNWSGPKADALRRDLTINGLLADPFDGNIRDYVRGEHDVYWRLIRFIGNAVDRCREDALRVFRFIRFAARLGRRIDPVIFDVVQDPIVHKRLALLSAERVRDEFLKTITVEDGNQAAWAMTMYEELGLLALWFPEMFPMIDHPQNTYHSHDVWGHTLLAVEQSKPELLHRLFALWHDVGKPICAEFKHKDYGWTFHNHPQESARIVREMAERLKFGHRDPVHLDLLHHLIEHHMDAFINGKLSKAAKRLGFDKFATEYGAQNILDLTWEVGRSDFFGRTPPLMNNNDKIRGADAKLAGIYEKVRDYIGTVENPVFSTRDLVINGNDVMTLMGIAPGPEVGKIIRVVFRLVQDGSYPNDYTILKNLLLTTSRKEFDDSEG